MPPSGHSTSLEFSPDVIVNSTMVFSLPELMLKEIGTLRTLGVQLGEMLDTSPLPPVILVVFVMMPFTPLVLSTERRKGNNNK
jgi:hypothetical protein